MPKQKTKKALTKRIKITSKGKLLRGHANSSHNKNKKNKSRQRRQAEPVQISGGFRKKFKNILGI